MQQAEWAPRTTGIVGCAVGAVVLAIVAALTAQDLPGRALTGAAAAGLLIFAAVSWRARPKLAITGDGLAVRGWWRTQMLRRPEVSRIRITEFRRIGRKVRLLEIETADDRLLILSRWDLGTDPLEVLDALTAAGFAGRAPTAG